MKEVKIYIDTIYAGNPANGTGTASMVLECETKDGQIATATHYIRYKGTTRNRLSILAVIEALRHIKVPCKITAHINNPLLVAMLEDNMLPKWEEAGWVGSRGDPVKNNDLLKTLLEMIRENGHEIGAEVTRESSYTRYMTRQIGKHLAAGEIEEKTDREYKQEVIE